VNFSIIVSDLPDGNVNDCDHYFDFHRADYADLARHLASIDWYYEFSYVSTV